MMGFERHLEAISELSHRQQRIGLSLLIKIFRDLLSCKEHKRPKPIKVNAIINKTKCYNFINILLSVGYYQITHGKQIKFDTANIHKIESALDTVTKYKNDLIA